MESRENVTDNGCWNYQTAEQWWGRPGLEPVCPLLWHSARHLSFLSSQSKSELINSSFKTGLFGTVPWKGRDTVNLENVCCKVMCYEILSKMSKERNAKIEGLVLLNVKNKTVNILIRPLKSEPMPPLFNVLLYIANTK